MSPSWYLEEAGAVCLNSLYGNCIFAFWLQSSWGTPSTSATFESCHFQRLRVQLQVEKVLLLFHALISVMWGKHIIWLFKYVWTDTFPNTPLWSKNHKASSGCIFRNAVMVAVSCLGICHVATSACRWDSSNRHIIPCWGTVCNCHHQACYLFYDFTITGKIAWPPQDSISFFCKMRVPGGPRTPLRYDIIFERCDPSHKEGD